MFVALLELTFELSYFLKVKGKPKYVYKTVEEVKVMNLKYITIILGEI